MIPSCPVARHLHFRHNFLSFDKSWMPWSGPKATILPCFKGRGLLLPVFTICSDNMLLLSLLWRNLSARRPGSWKLYQQRPFPFPLPVTLDEAKFDWGSAVRAVHIQSSNWLECHWSNISTSTNPSSKVTSLGLVNFRICALFRYL